jgi:GNAT superfamily N-acetyltransferase
MRIRSILPADFEAVRAIERDAGLAFAGIGMPDVAADEPPSIAQLEGFRLAKSGQVAVDESDVPVAYVLTSIVDGCAHIDQLSVLPSHRGRGIGAALIDHVATAAKAEGRPAVTLTTFRDVPWNAPHYRRLGFDVTEEAERGPQLAALVERERITIPSPAPRVTMRRSIRRGTR